MRHQSAGLKVVFLLSLGLTMSCCAQPSRNSVEWLAKYYRVDSEEIRHLAESLAVAESDLGEFGDFLFPVNYFDSRLSTIRSEKGKITKTDVEGIVRGYKVRCELDPVLVYYLFYSTNLDTRLFASMRGTPLVLEFYYRREEETGELILEQWREVTYNDSGFDYDRSRIVSKCLAGT